MVIDVLHNLKMTCDLLPQKNKCVLKHQKNYFFLIQEVMQRSHIRRNEGMRLYTLENHLTQLSRISTYIVCSAGWNLHVG